MAEQEPSQQKGGRTSWTSEWGKLKSELQSGRVQLKKGETPLGRVMNMPRGRWVIFGSVLLLSTAISTLFMPSREEMRELEEQQRTARQARLAALQAKQLPKD